MFRLFSFAKVGYGDLSDAGVQKIIDLFDENDDGEMDFFEFLEFFSFICLTLVKRNPKAKYRTAFFRFAFIFQVTHFRESRGYTDVSL